MIEENIFPNRMKGSSALSFDSVESALEMQLQMRERVILQRAVPTSEIHAIAGADACYSNHEGIASAVVIEYPGQKELCRSVSRISNVQPYLPGIFAFREGRGVLSALQMIRCPFDIIFFHGHGYAHPRRFGLASHIGVLIDRPTVGVADHLLVGEVKHLDQERGSLAPIIDGDEVIGMAVRTKEGSRPVFVSVGHRTDLTQAIELVLLTTEDHRMPEPIGAADRLARVHRRCGK